MIHRTDSTKMVLQVTSGQSSVNAWVYKKTFIYFRDLLYHMVITLVFIIKSIKDHIIWHIKVSFAASKLFNLILILCIILESTTV